MTTTDILTLAWTTIFPEAKLNMFSAFNDQKYRDITIDYASFSGYDPRSFNIDGDAIICFTEDGSEGVWIAVHHVRYDAEGRNIMRVGSVKTLNEGRDAWRDMGALAGELTYEAGRAAWTLYKASEKAEEARA